MDPILKSSTTSTSTGSASKRAGTESSQGAMKKKKLKVNSLDASPWQPSPPSLLHFVSPSSSPPTITTSSSSTISLDSKKIAFLDLDGTLIHTTYGASDYLDEWRWFNDNVLVELRRLLAEDFLLVLVSNQAGLRLDAHQQTRMSQRRSAWKIKIESIAEEIPDIPFQLFAAIEYDHYRKPMLGTFDYYSQLLQAEDFHVDLPNSFFVGDMAGRPNRIGFGKPQGDEDRKWAANLGLKFHTPEAFFGSGENERLPPLSGFRPRDLKPGPLFTPTSTPLIPSPLPSCEVVLFVGEIGIGKSHFHRSFFEDEGYVQVSQNDGLSLEQCVSSVKNLVAEGKRIVVDNTNRSREIRAVYVAIAKKHSVPIRCFYFNLPSSLAKHNNIYRLYPSAQGDHVSREEIASFKTAGLQVPVGIEEGWSEEVKSIGWVGWIGEEDSEEKRRWEGWMS
ncbi:polynucleotide kinase 3 phosphatase-domain-containing protein [Mrakia frigida]|uniref:polynucleotide kinase 3 phosphatase-domain-containing protein n=1 Tax=Mrakia frigida TaxID=29902 RepID=UPI003FCC1EDA